MVKANQSQGKRPRNHSEGYESPPPVTAMAGGSPTKTPLYTATNASRYERQNLIRRIQERSGCKLICYVSGPAASIDRDDTVAIVDLLHNIPQGSSVDLLLNTPGGDVDAAEKLMSVLRGTVGGARLRVIVPDFAKSAGTLIALGADAILMSDTSELGPIDPQITLNDGKGNLIRHSVLAYLDAFEFHSAALRANPADPVSRLMLEKMEPATLKVFEAARDRARKFAEDQLRQGMLAAAGGGHTNTEVAGALMDARQWPSHGQVINWQSAQVIGLAVEYVEPRTDLWQEYWQLYLLQRLATKERQKLFESDAASLSLGETE